MFLNHELYSIPNVNVFQLHYLHVQNNVHLLLGNYIAMAKCPKLTLVQQVEMCCRCEELSKNALKNTMD